MCCLAAWSLEGGVDDIRPTSHTMHVSAVDSLDVPLVLVLLLHEAALHVLQVLDVRPQLEHVHAAAHAGQARLGLAEVEDPLVENSVLDEDGLDPFLQHGDS